MSDQQPDFQFNLGDVVKDKITGYKGVIINRVQWLSNCNTYGVKCQKLKDGEPLDAQTFDEPQLELVKPKTIKPKQDTGGPTPAVRRTNRI